MLPTNTKKGQPCNTITPLNPDTRRIPNTQTTKGRLAARVEPKPPCGKKRIANRANWNKPPSSVPNKRSREASPCRRAPPGLLKGGKAFLRQNISIRTTHRSRAQKTRGAQGTSGFRMLKMLTKGGVICQQNTLETFGNFVGGTQGFDAFFVIGLNSSEFRGCIGSIRSSIESIRSISAQRLRQIL